MAERQAQVRAFATGADRDDDAHKADPEGAISPLVVERYARYMLAKSVRRDGTRRSADNWQRGMPDGSYMASLHRHLLHAWLIARGWPAVDDDGQDVDYEDALCAILFNASGLLHNQIARRLSAPPPPPIAGA